MHVCPMTDVHDGVAPLLLDDDNLEQAAPAVRALTLQRLEMIWRQVELNLDPDVGADPRWAEIGLRVLDRESKLYRLDRDKRVQEEDELEVQGVDRAAMIEASLTDIARRLSESG